ncbi:hypothetical protein ABZZ36_33490 [Actinacidiphila glaucinigra]|uniref:hypothetical protein n=1 Tax=Actinacidiphila glaucinigra TaxID=235986 RepID=UPI0033A22109
MPRPSDWNVVGLHGDPTPGDPVQIRQLVTDLSTIGSQARFIATAIDQVMNTADSSVFAGQTADALRGKIDDRLRNHINDVANSFEEVSRTLGDWANWVEEAQGKADGALSAARGLPQDDPQLEVHRHTAESAGAELGEHGSTVAGVINKASDIRLPISDCQVFWEMFQILAIILIVPALIFGGPIALLAFGVNMTLFVKAAIDFARGDIGFLDLFLAGLGIIAPTTKALPIFSIGKLIKSGVTAGIQWGRGSILSLRDIISGFRFATVFTGLRDVARMSLTWVRQGGLWVMQNFHNLPALGGSVFVKNGLVVIQGVRSIPVVVRGWTTAVRAGAPGAWKNFQLFAQETWSSQMAGGKWTRLLLPVTHTDIAEYGLKGALRMGFWDRGVMGRGVWDLPVGGTAAHTASAVPIGPHGATPHFDVARADINVARVDLADVRFGNFADTHTSIRPASFSVAPIDTVDLSGLRVGTINPVSVHGATSLVDGSTAGFRAVRHMDDVVDIAGTQLSGMKIDAFGVTPGQMSEGLGVSAAAPGGHVTHSSGLYVPGSAGTPAVHEGVDITALAAHGNGSLLSQGPIGVLTAPPGGTNALHTALTGVPAPAPGTTAVHDLLAAPGAPGAGTGAAHTALTGVQAPPSGAGVHDLLAAPGGTTGVHGPLTGVPGHQSGTSAGGSAFDVLAGGSKGTPNDPVPTHLGSSLDDNLAGAARANQAHLTLDEIVRPAGGARPGSVVTDTVPGPSAHGAPAPGVPKAGVHGIAPKDAARSAFDLLDDGRGVRPADGPAFAGAPGAGRTVDTDAGHAFAGAPAKSTDDVVVAPGTHDKVAVTGDGHVAVPLRQDPVPVRPSASGGGHVLSREADLLHEVNLKLGKMGSGAVTVEAVTAARQVLEDLRGAAFTKVDIRAQADQLAVHLAGPERGHLPGGVRDGDHTHDAPTTPGGHHAPPAPPRPPRPASGLLDGLDDVLPDDTGAPLGSRFDFDDDSVPGSPVGEHGTEDLDGFSEFVDLIRPLRQHIERALDNPAADIEVALVASPGGRTWREFSDDVGHAMVSVMLPGERKPLTIGFYPEDGNLFGNPGAIVNDAEYLLSGHVRVLGTYRITAEQLFEAYRYAMANSGAVYDLFRYNCVRFAEGFVSAALGKSVADLWVAAPYRLVDTMLRRDGAWHWADGTTSVAKLTADDTIRYQDAFIEVEDWRVLDEGRFQAATDQAQTFVLFDHQRPLIDGNIATVPQKERLAILGQFEKMITHTILTSGDDAGRQLSRQLGETYGTLRPGLSDLPGPSVTVSVSGDSLPGVGRGSVDSVPEPVPSPGGSAAGDSAGHLPPSSVQYPSDVQHMFSEIDDMLDEMGLFRHSLDDLPSGPPSPVHPGTGGEVHVTSGGEPHTPAVDKGKGKAPADDPGSTGTWSDHDGVRGNHGDDLSEIDVAASITDARRELINARTIRDDLQTRYVDGVGTSAEVDGVRYLESWQQVRQADAALAQAEAHWNDLTGGAPLPEVQSYTGHGLGGGARLPEGLRSLLHLKGRADAVPPAPEGVVQSVDHVPSATHVVTQLEGGKLSHALVPSGQDLTVAHWLDDPQSAYGRPEGNGKEAYEGDLTAHQDILTKGLARAEHNDDLTRVLTQQQESFLENVALFHALEGRTELRNLRMPQLSAIVMAERRALRTLAADTDALTTKLRSGDWDWAKGYRLDGADAGELIAKVHRHLQDELSLTVNLKLGNQVPGGGTLLDAMTADQQLLRNAWEIDNAGAGYYVTRGNTEEALGLPASVKRTTDASGIYPGQGGKSFAPTAADLADLPNYAALTSKYRPGGVKMYGQAVFHLKPNLMERATFTPADSFIEGLEGARSVTGRGNMLPLLNHGPEPLVRLAFAEATDFQFDDAFRGFRDAGTLERRLGRYFEAQLHGGVKWDDLDRVVLVDDGFDPALQARKLQLEQFAKDKGLSFTVEVHNARPGAGRAPGVHPAPPAPPAPGGSHLGGSGGAGPSPAHGPGSASSHPGGPETPPAPGGSTSGAAADGVHESYADLDLARSLLDEHGVPRDDLFTGTAARVERSGDASFVSPAAPAASGGTAKLTDDQILNAVVGTGGRNGDERRTLGGFEFGAGTRSNDGKNLVSRPVVVTVKDGGTEADVAVHLNVMLSSGNEADVTVTGGKLANTTEVTITGSKFHLTARPHTDQNLIDLHGPSSDTASKSIHVGPSNAKTGWNSRPGNTRNLAQSLGVSEQKLIEALDNRFPPSGLVETIHRFQDDVERAVVHGSGAEDVRVHFQGDKSFPVREDSRGVSAPAVTGLSGGAGDVLHGGVPGAGRVDLRLEAGWDAARGGVAPNTVKHSWVDPVSTPRGGGAHAPRYEVQAGYDVRRFEVGGRSVTDLTVRVRLAADGLSPSQVDALWDRAVSGVERVFNRPGAVLRDESVLHVTLERVTGNASDAHLNVNVGRPQGAMNQHQWRIDATEQDLAHELGHQLGLRDEYRDTTAGHRPEVDGSLMGNYHNAAPEGLSQGGLRPRYLDLIHGQVVSHDHVHVPHVGVDAVDGIAPQAPGKNKAKPSTSQSAAVPSTFTRQTDAVRFTDGFGDIASHYRLNPVAQYDGAAKGSLQGGEGTRFVATVIATPDTDLLKLAQMYGTAFGKESLGERLGLVIGVNGRVGKEAEIVDTVRKFAQQWEKEGDFSVSVSGFTWEQPNPQLLKDGGQKMVPYGALREAVVRDDLTRGMLDRLKLNAKGEVYLHVGDADVKSMVVRGEPLFDRAAAKIETLTGRNGSAPEMVSGGYTLPEGVAKNAADLDLAVRDAMAKTDTRAIYFPEPNTFVRVDPDNTLGLEKDIRFGEVSDRFVSYEAREGERLLDSSLKNRGFQWRGRENQGFVFDSHLALVTDGERIAKEVGDDPRAILSGLTQSHANPKTWTEQIERYIKLHHPDVLAKDPNVGRNLSAIAFHEIQVDGTTRLMTMTRKELAKALPAEAGALLKVAEDFPTTVRQLLEMAVDTRNALVDGINKHLPKSVSPSAPSASTSTAAHAGAGTGGRLTPDAVRILDSITSSGTVDGSRRTLAGFEFGKVRDTGSTNLISRPVLMTVTEGDKTVQVAVHLNVMVTPSGRLDGTSVMLNGTDFHLTARSKAAQDLIDKHGPSALTADNSIHVGPGNAKAGWDNRAGHLQNLADELGITRDSLIKALDRRFPPGELPDTVALFQRDVERAVVHASASEVITVEFRGDKSFPVQEKSAGVSPRAVDGPAGVVDDFFHGGVPGAGRVDLRLEAGWDAARGGVAPNTVKHSWVDPVSTPRGGGAHAPRYEVQAGYDVRRFEVGGRSVTDLTVRVRLAADGLSPSQVDALWDRAVSGVERVFNRPGAVLRDESVLHVTLERVTGNASDAHLNVKVGGSRGAMNQHQWRIDATEQDLAHELGHQLGLRDEYRDTTAGHRPEVDGSLMGNYHNAAPEGLSQGGLRPRYLDLIHTQVASHDHVHVPHLPAASGDVIVPGGSGAAELDLLDPAVFKARTSGSGAAIDAVERRLSELHDVHGTDLAGRITALDELTTAADDFLTAHRGAPGAAGAERMLVQARAESGAYRLLQERAAFGTGHGGGVAALDDLATRVRAVLAGDDLTQATRVRLLDALTGTERQAGALRLLAGNDVPAAPAPAPAAAGRGADDVPWAEDYRRVEELLGREGDPRREGWADLTRARQDLGTAEDALPHGEASTSQGLSTIEELLRSDTLAARDRVTSATDGLRDQGIDPHQVETRIRDVHEQAAVERGATPGAGKLSDLPDGPAGTVTRVELSDSGVEGANGLVIERTAADGSVTHRVLGRGLEPDEGRTVVFRDGGFDVRHTASDTVVRYNESGIRTAQEVSLRNAAGDPNGLRLHTDLNGHGRPEAARLTGPDAGHHLAEPLEDGTVRVTDTRTGETTRHRTGGHPIDGGLRLRGADGTPAEGDLVLVREDGTTRVTDVQGRDVTRAVTPLEDGAGFRITDDVSGASVRHDGAGRLQESGLSLTRADGGRGDLFLARDGAGTHTLTNAHGVPQRGDVTVLPGDAGFRIIDDGTGATSRHTPDGRWQDAGTALADPADGARGARVVVADGGGGVRLTDGLGRPLTERVTDVGGGRFRTFDDTTGRSVLHDVQGRHVETGTALADPVAGTRGDRFVVPDAATGHRLTDATGAALPDGVQALPGNGGFRVAHATGYRTFAPDGAFTGDGLRLTGRGGVPAGHLDRAAGGGQRWLDDAFAPDAQRAVTVHGNGHIEIARPGNGHQVFHGTTGELVQEVTPLPGGGRQVTAAHGSFARHDATGALTAHGTPLPDEAGGRVLVTRAPSADEPNGAHWLEDPAGDTIRHWDATAQPAGGVRIECTLPGGPRRGEFLELDPDGMVVRQGFNVLDKGRTTPYQYVLDHGSGTWARTGGPDGAPRGVFHHGTADLTGVANGRVVLLSATGAPVPVFERRVLPGGGLLDSFRRTDTIAFGRTNPRTSWARWGDEAALSGSGIREYDTAGTGWRDLDGRGDVVHEYQAGLQKHTNGTGHTLALRDGNGDLRWHRYDGAGKELAEGPRTPDRFDSGWTDLADDGQTVVQRKWGMGRLPEHAGQYEEHKIVRDAAAPGGWRTDGTWQRQSPHGKEVGKAEVVDGHLLVTERWREQRPPVWVRKAWLPGARNAEGGYAHVLGDNAHQLFTWQKRPIGTATGEVTSGVRYVGLDGGVLDLTADGRFARLTTKLHDGTTLKVGDHAARPDHAPAAAGHQPWEAGQSRGYRVPQDPAATGLLWRDEYRDTAGVHVVREGLPGGVVREYTTPRAVDAAAGHGTWVTRDAHGNLTGMRQPNPDGTVNSFIEGVGKTDSAKWTWREVDAEGTPLGASGTRTFFRGSNDPKLSWDDSFRDRDAGGRLVRERRMLDKGRYVQAWRDPADDNRWLTAAYDRTGRGIDPGPGRQVRSWWNGTSWQDQWSRGARHFRDELRPLPGTQGATVRLREVPVGLGGPLRVREYDPAAATPHSVWKEFDHESVVRERKAVRGADGTVTGYLETDAWRGQWNRYDADGGLVAQRTDSGLVWERRGPFGQMRLVGNEYDYRGALTEIRGWGRRIREAQRMPWSGTVVPDGAGAALREARYEPYWRTVAYKAAVEFGQEFVLEFAANLVVNAIVDAAQHKKFNGDDVLKAFANAAVSSGVKTGLGIAVHENRIPGLRNLGNLKTTLANVDGGKHPQRRPFNHDKTWTNEWAGNETATRWRGGIYDFAFSAGTSVISGWVNGSMNAAVWGVSDANGNTVKLSGADAFLDGGINATAALTTSASTALVKNVVVLGGGSRLFHRQGFADFWIQLPFKIFEKSIQSVYLTGAYRASINPSWYQVPPAGTQQKQ